MERDQRAQRPFLFFKLPPEMRKIVYGHLKSWVQLNSKQIDAIWHGGGVRLEKPNVNLMLVSQQFKDEYEHEVGNRLTVPLEDDVTSTFAGKPPIGPSEMAKVTCLRLSLIPNCEELDETSHCIQVCESITAIRHLSPWTENFCRGLKRLQSLEIELDVPWTFDKKYVWPKSPHFGNLQSALDDLTKTPCLSSVRVHKNDIHPNDDFGERHGPWATWDPTSGWRAAKF